MGMFDWVILDNEISCPECGERISRKSWQTKDGDCNMDVIPEAFLQLNGISSFHALCKNYHWVQFYADSPLPDTDSLVPGHPITYVMAQKK